jgi:hypothetical protein
MISTVFSSRARRGRFVRDDKFEMLIVYGLDKTCRRSAFEGQEPFIASESDVVDVPANTWHATRFFGPEPACRLSITEYVGNTVLLEPR